MQMLDYDILEQALRVVRSQLEEAGVGALHGGFVLGSGWKGVSKAFSAVSRISYENIPGLGACTVDGHDGELLLVKHKQSAVYGLVFLGRRHYYERGELTSAVLPIYLLKQLGAEFVLLTNAAGGVGGVYKPGALMNILDHDTNIPDPMIGSYRAELGEQFVDMSEPYSRELGELLSKAALETDTPLVEGSYFASTGPSFESPARVQRLKQLGFHALGMSTVPEAIAAKAWGLKAVGLSCITNFGAGITSEEIKHQEIALVVEQQTEPIVRLLTCFWSLTTKKPPRDKSK